MKAQKGEEKEEKKRRRRRRKRGEGGGELSHFLSPTRPLPTERTGSHGHANAAAKARAGPGRLSHSPFPFPVPQSPFPVPRYLPNPQDPSWGRRGWRGPAAARCGRGCRVRRGAAAAASSPDLDSCCCCCCRRCYPRSFQFESVHGKTQHPLKEQTQSGLFFFSSLSLPSSCHSTISHPAAPTASRRLFCSRGLVLRGAQLLLPSRLPGLKFDQITYFLPFFFLLLNPKNFKVPPAPLAPFLLGDRDQGGGGGAGAGAPQCHQCGYPLALVWVPPRYRCAPQAKG